MFQEKVGEKFWISLLNMKDFLRWDGEADPASSQQLAAVLKDKMYSGRAQNYATIFLGTDHRLLREAGTRQVRKVSRASTALRISAANDVRMAQ